MNKFTIIEPEEVSKKSSPWGNDFLEITAEDISALYQGKVLYYDDGEYGTFIKLSEEDMEILKKIF